MSLKVKRFLTSVNASNLYLCWCENTGEAVIIDPSEKIAELDEIVDEENLRVVGIFITHSHFDHDSALAEYRQMYDVPLYSAGSYEDNNLVKGGDEIVVGDHGFIVAATPGHTEDSRCFVSDNVAFVGDALFAAAVGGTSNRKDFEREVDGVREFVFALPDNTTIYSGHGPATTVSVERCYNPFFI